MEKVDVKVVILRSNVNVAAENNVSLTRQDYRDGIIILHCQECGCQRKFKPLRGYRNQRYVSRTGKGAFSQKRYGCTVCGDEIWF